MYKNKTYNIAIKLDKENKALLAYTLTGDVVEENTEGILNALSTELNSAVSEHYNIDTADYGVEVSSEEYFYGII